jgi:hypothetical protein
MKITAKSFVSVCGGKIFFGQSLLQLNFKGESNVDEAFFNNIWCQI